MTLTFHSWMLPLAAFYAAIFFAWWHEGFDKPAGVLLFMAGVAVSAIALLTRFL